ncbi:MAG: permease [Minicystis sp.]
MFAIALALSLLGLALGPALVALGRKQALLFAALEGLTLGLVPALVLLRLLPHLYEETGPLAAVLMVAGYAGFWIIERRSHQAGAHLRRTVVVPAMAVHSLLDGGAIALAFATEYGPASVLLGGALVLHRLPEGLLLATTLTPQIGFRRMLHMVALVGAATVIGALGGHAVIESVPHAALHGFVAFGLGVMLRLAVHRHAPPPVRPVERTLGGLGFLAGIVILPLVGSPEDVLRQAQPRELAILESLGPLFLECAPALLLGLVSAAVLRALSPQHVLPGRAIATCTRGLMPMTRRMLVSGVAPAVAVALVIATRQLDPVGAALSFSLLGTHLTLLRMAAGLLVAAMLALLAAAATFDIYARCRVAEGPGDGLLAPPPLATRLRRTPGDIIRPLLDHTAAWFLLGLLAAAAIEAAVPAGQIAAIGAPLDVLLGAMLALPVHGCALATIPLALVLIHKGASVGAAVAFLIVASTTNRVVLALVKERLGVGATAIIGGATIALAVVAGLVADTFLVRASVPDLHALVEHRRSALEWAAAGIAAALLALSLLRAGPWAWLGAGDDGCEGAPRAHDEPHAHGSHFRDI